MVQHDSCDDNTYIKRCECYECAKKLKDWEHKKKKEGKVHCQRKVITFEKVICEQEIKLKKQWGHEHKYEGVTETCSESARSISTDSESSLSESKHKKHSKKNDKKHSKKH